MTNEELLSVISNLENNQKLELEQLINFMISPDVEEPAFEKIKHRIYEQYSTTASQLIAKVEVYEHDLPNEIRGLIETSFRSLSASATVEEEKALDAYMMTLYYQSFLVNTLYGILIKLYIKKIKKLKQTFKKFNYHSVKAEQDTPLMAYLDSQLNKICNLYKKKKKSYKEYHDIDKKTFALQFNVDVHTEINIPNWYDGFVIAEKTLEIAEKKYPDVIGNGYRASLTERFLKSVPNLISNILLLLGIIGIIVTIL